MSFERAQKIADAVLLEGYLLYPYRPSTKNDHRFTFGVVAPRAFSEAGGGERWSLQTELLLQPPGVTGADVVWLRLRHLQMQRRTVEAALPEGFVEVSSLDAAGVLHVPFDEAVLCESDLVIRVDDALSPVGIELEFGVEAARTEEMVAANGVVLGRIVREREAITGCVHLQAEEVPAGRPLLRMTLRVENHTPWLVGSVRRDRALRKSLLSAHLLLWAPTTSFVSSAEPPGWAARAASACKSDGLYPVLVGERDDLLLATPIMLPDRPQLALESPGDLSDATEIDELLALRVRTLTDHDKRLARATDPRAARIIDHVAALDDARLERLHDARQAPGVDSGPPTVPQRAATVGGARVPPELQPGRHVRLRPGLHRADAQDARYAGRTATVERVMQDGDGNVLLAVTLDDDPAGIEQRFRRQFHTCRIDEVEPIELGGPEVVP